MYRAQRSGFSVVEIMVSLVIVAFGLTCLLAVMTKALDLSEQSSRNTMVTISMRTIWNMITAKYYLEADGTGNAPLRYNPSTKNYDLQDLFPEPAWTNYNTKIQYPVDGQPPLNGYVLTYQVLYNPVNGGSGQGALPSSFFPASTGDGITVSDPIYGTVNEPTQLACSAFSGNTADADCPVQDCCLIEIRAYRCADDFIPSSHITNNPNSLEAAIQVLTLPPARTGLGIYD